jgi:hypothetical protein
MSGTYPSGEQSSAAPTWSATGATTLRMMDPVAGKAQTSIAGTSSASTSAQNGFIGMWVSRPLSGSQTVGGGTLTINVADAESNTSANFFVNSANIYVWRPSTGAKVGTLTDAIGGGITGSSTEATAASTEQVSTFTLSTSSVSALDGDVVVVELWASFTQAMATAYTCTTYYDGTTTNTTENATVSNHAAFVELAENLTFKTGAVRYIRDSMSGGSNVNGTNYWVEIQAKDASGTNLALNRTPTVNFTVLEGSVGLVTDGVTNNSFSYLSGNGNPATVTIDLGSIYEIYSITRWHFYDDARVFSTVKTEVSIDNSNWFTIYDSSTAGTYPESSAGATNYAPWGTPIVRYGTVNATLGAATLSADGSVGSGGRTGNLSATLGAVTLSAAATLPIAASSSVTLGSVTSSAAGTVAIVGTATPTLGAVTASSAGTVAIAGSASVTLDSTSLSADASHPDTGALNATLGAATTSASGGVFDVADLSATLGAVTTSADGGVLDVADASNTLGAVTIAADAGALVLADLSSTLGAVTLDATGSIGTVSVGDLNVTLGAISAQSDASVVTHAQASVMLGAVSVSSDATVSINATVNALLADVTASGAAQIEVHGVADVTLSAVGLASDAQVAIVGNLGVTLEAFTLSSTGNNIIPVISDEMRYTVPAESHVYTVAAENRTYTIAADNQTYTVEAANQTYTIAADQRQYTVPAANQTYTIT